MRVLTPDTVLTESERYRSLLEANGWTLKPGDVFIDKVLTSKRAGSTRFNDFNISNDTVIYLIPSALTGVEGIDIMNGGVWKTQSVKVRVLGDKPLIVKGTPSAVYSGIRLFGPKNFDVDLRCNLLKRGLIYNSQGVLKNHLIQFASDKGGNVKFCGWQAGGGGFTIRLFEFGSDTDPAHINTAGGLIEDFEIDGTISEGIYLGSIKKFHTLFKNLVIRNGKILNSGSEALQLQNLGEGCLVENITIGRTGTEFPSPFQNYQFGTLQVKAGGGSFKIRNITIENGGDPVFSLFSSAPVKDTAGILIQEGSKPGDVVEISNITSSRSKGSFLYQHNSCVNGAHWVFDDIQAGEITKRIAQDVGISQPYAFLADPAGTDKITFKSITTDNSLPLTGKAGAKFIIEKHTVVDKITQPTFVKPFYPGSEVFSYYQFYNQVSQRPFYNVAGQPVKFRAGDIVYFDQLGQPRRWFRSDRDQSATSPAPGEGFTEIVYDCDYSILDPKDVTIQLLTDQLKAAQEKIEDLHAQAENLNAVILNLENNLEQKTNLLNQIHQLSQ
jgi:hypothetical protein